MVKYLKVLIGLVAILAGVYSLFFFTPNLDLALQFLSLSFGILAIIWTVLAFRNLSPNSSLKHFTLFFLFALCFTVLHSIWVTSIIVFGLQWPLSVVLDYLLVSFGYVSFGFAAYNIFMIGKEFGFRPQAEIISRAVEKNAVKVGSKAKAKKKSSKKGKKAKKK